MDDRLETTRRAEATHFWFYGFRRFLTPVLADVAGGRRGLRLLDCGCGVGQNGALLRPYGRVYAFELTAHGAAYAAATGESVLRADITRIPFRSGSFDITTSFDVLQCVERDEDAVGEMARVLRPGGALVLTMGALAVLSGDHSEVWEEVRRYTPATARRVVERAGLRLERMTFLFASLFPLMLAVRTMQRLLRPIRQAGDSDMRVPPAPVNAVLRALVKGEAALLRRVPMPVGSTLLVVARKPGGP